jgi:Ca2+/H+ antiporter, TMEM165/GDT1 family
VNLLFTALAVVFVAEIGDKSLLVALGFGARHKLTPVLLGMAIAYMTTNLMAVTAGELLGRALPTRAIGVGAGVLFLVFAALGLRELLRTHVNEDPDEVDKTSKDSQRSVMVSVAMSVFLAELGDKTQLSTAALAAKGAPLLVWIGSTLGVFLASGTGVLIGRALGSRFPERLIQAVSVVLFAAVGVLMIAAAVGQSA